MPSLRARWSVVCLAVVTSLSLPTLLSAQGTSGRILGRIADPSGAILAGVKVRLVNEGTGVGRDSKTNESGDYDFVEVPVGTCVGLLGPNGAGKSTTMRTLTAQAIADEGEIEVLGYRLPRESKQARAECGVVPQLTVEENLRVFAWLYRLGRRERRPAIERALEIANLGDRRDTRVDKLSGGMRRRLLIARALVHRPRLVLLDEPTVGLDPQVRQELWALIDGLRTEGVSILMSTHYIEEAERLADEVAVMTRGKVISRGRPADLIAEHAGERTAEVYAPPQRLTELRASAEEQGLRVRPAGPAIAIVGSERAAAGAIPEEAVVRAATLEDVFVLLTGEEVE